MYKAKDICILLNMQDALGKIAKYAAEFGCVEEFFAAGKEYDAVLMNFIVVGEMAEKLSDAFKEGMGREVDWFKIKGLRNVIAHDYYGLDEKNVWKIIQEDLPPLRRHVDDYVERLEELTA